MAVRLLSWAQEAAAGATTLTELLLEADVRPTSVEPPLGQPSEHTGAAVAAVASAEGALRAAKTLYADAVGSPQYPLDALARQGLAALVAAAREHQDVVADAISTPR